MHLKVRPARQASVQFLPYYEAFNIGAINAFWPILSWSCNSKIYFYLSKGPSLNNFRIYGDYREFHYIGHLICSNKIKGQKYSKVKYLMFWIYFPISVKRQWNIGKITSMLVFLTVIFLYQVVVPKTGYCV